MIHYLARFTRPGTWPWLCHRKWSPVSEQPDKEARRTRNGAVCGVRGIPVMSIRRGQAGRAAIRNKKGQLQPLLLFLRYLPVGKLNRNGPITVSPTHLTFGLGSSARSWIAAAGAGAGFD